ncbi:MAG: protein-glutamate O-methyltransferase CheR [SAR324 cluster bacterium]|nr:protein-glutamate O-methyltransferase CheR [SAR324 cluster bacterium]
MISLEPPNYPVEDIILIRDLVASHSGINYDEKKFYFLEKRIARRIQATNSKNIKEYYRLLSLGDNADEIRELINTLTTNETYFFRNAPQLDSFVKEVLPLIVKEKEKNNDYTINIWSAGCSSGDEAYTLSILLKENLPNYTKWKINILATDIDTQILDKAKLALYDQRAIKDVSPQLLKTYFHSVGNRYQVVPEIKNLVTFEQLNLLDRKAMRQKKNFDFTFCRNVLIYFNEDARKRVVSSFYDSLRPGGFIFLGHSESVGKLSAAFKLIKFNKSLSYQK